MKSKKVKLLALAAGGLLLAACSASHKGANADELEGDAAAILEEPGRVDGGTRDGDGSPVGDAGGAIDSSLDRMDGSVVADDAAQTGDAATISADAASIGADAGQPGSGGPFFTNDAGQVLCGGEPCACSDGLDNDTDGVLDLADPECVSSWDDDEGSLATGIPGDNKDEACQDCFFDGNSGSGNDGCRVPTSCILLGNASSGRGSCSSCEQPKKCQDFCRPYTPNGCDCFGCCEIRLPGGATTNVKLGNGCSIDGATISGCTQCVPNPSCNNSCGRCELCPGKTAADLPADCTTAPDSGVPGEPPAPPYTCEGAGTVCGEGLPGCPTGALCQFGCCVLTPGVL